MLVGSGLLVIVIIAALVVLSIASRTAPASGLLNDRLRPCPNKQNCVCSEFQDDYHIEPLKISLNDIDINKYAEVVKEMNGKIVSGTGEYLHATFTTPIMRFIDDFEVRIDRKNMLLHIRSASRVGYSDLGANRKRVAEFKNRLIKN